MNTITLQGIIKNIEYSHNIQDIEFNKAKLLVPRENGKEDLIELKFKRFTNPYKENETIELTGNIRTYTHKVGDKNKVDIYVFTYFDIPEKIVTNECEIDGVICKKDPFKKTRDGKDVLDFTLANNIDGADNHFLNCYIPCVAWGNTAKLINKLEIGTKIKIIGQLHSREYKKKITEDDFEIRIAHEVSVNTFERLERYKNKESE